MKTKNPFAKNPLTWLDVPKLVTPGPPVETHEPRKSPRSYMSPALPDLGAAGPRQRRPVERLPPTPTEDTSDEDSASEGQGSGRRR